MQKARPISLRFRLWMAGLLILAGTLLLVSTWHQQAYWRQLHPSPSGPHAISDRTYSGVLSETNQSVVVPLEDFDHWGCLYLQDISTNNTPVTLTLRDWNNTVVLQLVNCTDDSDLGSPTLAFYGMLAHYAFPGTPTLTIARETSDVTFSVHVVIYGYIAVMPAPAPFLLFLVGYLLSVNATCGGFVLIETVIRDLRRGLL